MNRMKAKLPQNNAKMIDSRAVLPCYPAADLIEAGVPVWGGSGIEESSTL
jgi:hypothetical protein